MFGYSKFRKSLEISIKYARTLFAPASVNGKIPNAAFGDGYVIGFLQVLTMHATNEGYGKVVDGSKAIPVFEALMENLVPGYGRQITDGLIKINKQGHPAYQNYMVGRREANDYIAALMTNDEQKSFDSVMSFTDFIKRNYMGLSH